MKAPPPRPIISGSGSITENASLYVQHHIKDVSRSHSSYLEDTPDFLRAIEKINEGPNLPVNALLVTMDATYLYDNIPNDEGGGGTRGKTKFESTNKFYQKNV